MKVTILKGSSSHETAKGPLQFVSDYIHGKHFEENTLSAVYEYKYTLNLPLLRLKTQRIVVMTISSLTSLYGIVMNTNFAQG